MSGPSPRAIGAALALLALATTGCGSADDAPPPRRALVDQLLRPAVSRASADDRSDVRYVATRAVLDRPIARDRTALLALVAPIFPVWDPHDDGVSASRIVAEDRPVLVVPATGPRSADDLPERTVVLRPRTPDTARRAAAGVADELPRALGGRRSLRVRETASDPASLAAVRAGRAGAAIVLRSALRRDGSVGLRILPLDEAVAPRLRLQVGTVAPTERSSRLRTWLVGPAGRRALRAAGFDGPGPAPTSEPCVAGTDGCR